MFSKDDSVVSESVNNYTNIMLYVAIFSVLIIPLLFSFKSSETKGTNQNIKGEIINPIVRNLKY